MMRALRCCVEDVCVYQVDAVQDADPQSHEGFGEVDDLLSLRGDGEAGYGQVGLLHRERERERQELASVLMS